MRLLAIILLFGTVLLAGKAHAGGGLDQKAVHAEYENGNFDSVLGMIALFEKRNPRYSREDSLFIARHLAVVHAANPKTVEVGKHWMHRMLSLQPSADLEGMYVNEEIDRIFDKVRREFIARQAAAGVDVSSLMAPSRAGNAPGDKRSSLAEGSGRGKWLWIGAGGIALAAAIAYMVLSGESPESGPDKVEVEL